MNDRVIAELDQLKEEMLMRQDEYQANTKRLELKVEYLRGMVEGLKFSVRCNGVSGNEVK